MKVIASAAISSDGYLDDSSEQRLVLSCAEDWAEVHELRAQCDAILVGAQTVRADNPSLLIKDECAREARVAEGRCADIDKVVICGSGQLDPQSRFFKVGECRKFVFVSESADTRSVEALREVATIVALPEITAQEIIRILHEHGIESLMVEGGARTLKMFLDEESVDQFRLAVSHIKIDDQTAPQLYDADKYLSDCDLKLKCCKSYTLGNMEIRWFERTDVHYMRMAIEQSRQCTPSQTSYCVGAVIVTCGGETFCGYTHQTSPTNHAEEEAIAQALAAKVNLKGATMYSTIEPCSTRMSKSKSCSTLIIEHGFSKVVFALYEPDTFVNCVGASMLAQAGIEVKVIEQLANEVRKINSHIIG